MIVKGKLLKKLQDAGIQVEEVEYKEFNDDMSFEIAKRSIAKFPCGREFKNYKFGIRPVETKTLLASSFERYRFIKDYEAVWSMSDGIIECTLQNVSRMLMSGNYQFNQLARRLGLLPTKEDEAIKRIDFDQGDNNYKASIGYASVEHAILSAGTFGVRNFESCTRRITIRIENIELKSHDQALDLLEKIGNSLLFKIDLTSNISFKLAVDETRRSPINRVKTEYIVDLTFPIYEYDKEPMSLYWYAKSAHDMPLLRFLALYQILEFYFPIFSQKEAHQTVQNIIKDPRFDPNKDSNITKILSSITHSKNQNGFGSEIEQLKATMVYCVTGEDIRDLIESDLELSEYFKEKKSKQIASKGINLASNNIDLVMDCAERIYEIRCRVVHTKASDKNYNLLLPSSPELRNLKFDTVILENVAKKVLISSSRTLKI